MSDSTTLAAPLVDARRGPSRDAPPDYSARGEWSLEDFLSELRRMSTAERVRASRYSFSRSERTIWAARYPEEVPLVNGEFEWIALNLE